MSLRRTFRRLRTAIALLGGCTGLFVSAMLLQQHARVIVEARDVSVPLVSAVPTLNRRLAVLTAQVETAELHVATRLGSLQEQRQVYVLPDKPDLDRFVAILEAVSQVLRDQHLIADVEELQLGTSELVGDGLVGHPVTMRFAAHADGLQQMLVILDNLAGVLTIGDALNSEERALLLERSEQENPAGIVALEQFLSTSLLAYALDTRAYEQMLLRTYPSASFETAFRSVVDGPRLKDARRILGGDIGRALDHASLWPLPLLSVAVLEVQRGSQPQWGTVGMTVKLYTRTGK